MKKEGKNRCISAFVLLNFFKLDKSVMTILQTDLD